MIFVAKKEKFFLILLLLFSFFVRALFFNFFLKNKDLLNFDSAVYNNVAFSIANGYGITEPDGSSHYLRVPGYSIFLACGYKFFSDDIKKNLWIQIFLSAFIPLLVFYLSLILFPNNIFLAKICSLICVIHPGFTVFSGLVMSETFFALFFLIFLILFLSQIQLFFCKTIVQVSFLKIFMAGLFLGFSSMFRPVGHYLFFFSTLLLFFSNFNFVCKIKSGLFLFLGWGIVVVFWLLRNFLLTGYIFFHTLPGIHFLKHSAARIDMEISGCSYISSLTKISNEFNDLLIKSEEKLGRKPNGIEVCLLAEELSGQYFKKNIFITFKHFILNMFKTCFSLYSAEIMFFDSGGVLPEYAQKRNIFLRFLFPEVSNKLLILAIYLEILFLFLLLIGFVGFVFSSFFYKELFCVFAKTFPYICLFIVVSLACGFARLRLPIEPFLIVFSCKFWFKFLGWVD